MIENYFDFLEEKTRLDLESLAKCEIAIFSNITVSPLDEIIFKLLAQQNVVSSVTMGDFDNFIQNAQKFKECNFVVIFWEVFGFFKEVSNKGNLEELLENIKNEIKLTVRNLESVKKIIFNKFFVDPKLKSEHEIEMRFLAKELNNYLLNEISPNTKNIYISDVFSEVEDFWENEIFNYRMFKVSESLYRNNFLLYYAKEIIPIMLYELGIIKKVLVLDCDNTLWRGTIGEDGIDGIENRAELQQYVVELFNKGVLICLSSKNNPEDVDEVIKNDENFLIPEIAILIKKVNWDSKVLSIKDIGETLSVGNESIVFIDDSDFELEHVRSNLPHVTTLKYENEHKTIKALRRLFWAATLPANSINKTEQYRTQFKRQESKKGFESLEDYLASLEIEIVVNKNNLENLDRVTELCKKTNQFNFMGKRYSKAEVENFIYDEKFDVINFSISDKFGESGITALLILDKNLKREIKVDTFLMSCRIIGRNIEYAIMDFLFKEARKWGVKWIRSSFVRTKKNIQLEGFYEKLGFKIVEETEEVIKYEMKVNEYLSKNINYLRMYCE